MGAVATAVGEDAQNLVNAVGVQAQVFTIVNDESYYYPDLMRGAIVDGQMWYDVAAYTGSTTGTTRNNEICSNMKQQPDDMSDDLHAHGARELVATALTANNLAAAPGGNGGNPR